MKVMEEELGPQLAISHEPKLKRVGGGDTIGWRGRRPWQMATGLVALHNNRVRKQRVGVALFCVAGGASEAPTGK